ncbi:MAG: hypothetical protein ABL929_10820 [Ferruginibacter sp.]
MPSTSETGHAKNVANFEDLISFCNGYGAAYNPSKDSLSIAKLKDLQTASKSTLQEVKTNKTGFDNATNARQLAFKDLKPFATKIVNALAVSGATDLVVANSKTVNRKIQGAKANGSTKIPTTPTDPNTPIPTDKTISTSQQSYDSLIDHFTKLIETVSQEPSYKPNETELKTTTLQTKLDDLKTTNSKLIDGYTNWSNARINRNTTLYNPLTGLVQTALEVKKYVKSVFGATSPQFKQVSGLEFSNVKDR